MKKLFIALAIIGLAGSLPAQTRQRVVPRGIAGAPGGPWSIEFVSTGGFGGAGFGDIRISSDGKLVVGQFVSGGKTCESLLPQGELAAIDQMVRSLRASTWVSSYIPADTRATCCDLFFVNVTLVRAEQEIGSTRPTMVTYKTQFIASASNLPGDLAGLRDSLAGNPDSYLTRYQRVCSPAP